ncbi:MAG: hypothetical protein K2O66_02200, partial [Bacteroidales bacterium]|nr:hypothetical protein [Bacteroidales bacterium]
VRVCQLPTVYTNRGKFQFLRALQHKCIRTVAKQHFRPDMFVFPEIRADPLDVRSVSGCEQGKSVCRFSPHIKGDRFVLKVCVSVQKQGAKIRKVESRSKPWLASAETEYLQRQLKVRKVGSGSKPRLASVGTEYLQRQLKTRGIRIKRAETCKDREIA